MKKNLKILVILALLVLLFLPVYANMAVEKTYSQGVVSPLTNQDLLIIDTPALSVAYFDFNDLNPLNLIVYLGGFPDKKNSS